MLRTRLFYQRELASFFHSWPCSAQAATSKSSRTKRKRRTPSRQVEKVSILPEFQRDPVPHEIMKVHEKAQEASSSARSFRRRSEVVSEKDWRWRNRSRAPIGWAAELRQHRETWTSNLETGRHRLRATTSGSSSRQTFARGYSTFVLGQRAFSSTHSPWGAAARKVASAVRPSNLSSDPFEKDDHLEDAIPLSTMRGLRHRTEERRETLRGLPYKKPLVKPLGRTGRGKVVFSSPKRSSVPPRTPESKSFPGFGFLNSEPLSPSPSANQGSNLVPLVKKFSTPPLIPPLLSCLTDLLGPSARPTEIQSLAMGAMLEGGQSSTGSKEYLLASETGSGKSIAYLLPVLQNLKLSETTERSTTNNKLPLNPRALFLTPTHELARQTGGFAKALVHADGARLRVLCISSSKSVIGSFKKGRGVTAPGDGMTPAQMKAAVASSSTIGSSGEFIINPEDMQRNYVESLGKGGDQHPVDVVVGTPMKMMELVRGRGWDRLKENGISVDKDHRRGRDVPLIRDEKERLGNKYMGLQNVQWVVVDEADVLFDPDFQQVTRMLLADISRARGVDIEVGELYDPKTSSPPAQQVVYPFSLVLSSATLPPYLSSYLSAFHPNMTHLMSKGVHHFPRGLDVEYTSWRRGGGVGGKMADVERRIREVWKEDSVLHLANTREGRTNPNGQEELSKILIFVNKSTSVDSLSEYLSSKEIKNVALTSTSEERTRGMGSNRNKHLEGFLKPLPKPSSASVDQGSEIPSDLTQAPKPVRSLTPLSELSKPSATPEREDKETPRVLITTSLLSRGLDFSPTIKHVFIVDEPKNLVDFLHRAGRAARAGHKGKVVIFGDFGDKNNGVSQGLLDAKGKVRKESERAREIRRKVGELR